jgi:oligoendopeptidase F
MTVTTHGFVPAELDAAVWDEVEPLLSSLRDRAVTDRSGAEAWLVDRSELEASIEEAGTLLYINMSCDTSDKSASDAYRAYISDFVPKLKPLAFELDRVQADLCERFGLAGERYEVLARDTTASVRLFRPENVPLETRLETLGQDYQAITGAMTVVFDGAERTLPQMGPYFERTDRSVRESAYRTVAERRLVDAEKLDALYDEQVKLRDEVAKNAGFDGFVDYAFVAKHRFDYTPEDCRAFHDAIASEVMPLCRELDAERVRDLGIDELRPWDLSVDPKGREPLRPFDGGADLVHKTRAVMRALDPELASMFEGMGDGRNANGVRDGASLDLDSRSGKAPGGYQAMLQKQRKPFIFMNAAGVQRDVETMVHEAGHAFHAILCSGDPLLHYRSAPIEFAEVASMSMELLSMRHWGTPGGYFTDEAELARAQRGQLKGSITMLSWIATIDAFQHWVYANPGHSRGERRDAWLDLERRFGVRGAGVAWPEDLGEWRARTWQAQLHLFEVPLYYVEYGIAQLGALQLWLKSLEEGEAAAVTAYKRALSLGGARPLPELFEAAGLRFDFGRETVARLVERVRAELARLPE